MFSSCGPVKDIAYFQNKVVNEPEKIDKYGGIVIQPNDILSIVVSSRNPELAVMFNLPLINFTSGADASYNTHQKVLGYTVDPNGKIDYPVLGELNVSGMTRVELAELLKKKLISQGLLNDAGVTVEFMNFKFSVLGEVNAPGTYTSDTEKITILQALSWARDLTIYGLRENVSVIREKDGKRTIYEVNLCDVSLFDSPAYYLMQNDVVYVQPNPQKASQSKIDDKKLRNATIALSTSSLLVSVATLIVGLIN